MAKPLKIVTNNKGVKFAIFWEYKFTVDENKFIIKSADKTYGVFQLCENYDGRVKGGMRSTWRYIKKDMSLEDANALIMKKTRKTS